MTVEPRVLNCRALPYLGPADLQPVQSLSVVICTYTIDRWEDLCRSVESVLADRGPQLQIVLVVDHNDSLYRSARQAMAITTALSPARMMSTQMI